MKNIKNIALGVLLVSFIFGCGKDRDPYQRFLGRWQMEKYSTKTTYYHIRDSTVIQTDSSKGTIFQFNEDRQGYHLNSNGDTLNVWSWGFDETYNRIILIEYVRVTDYYGVPVIEKIPGTFDVEFVDNNTQNWSFLYTTIPYYNPFVQDTLDRKTDTHIYLTRE